MTLRELADKEIPTEYTKLQLQELFGGARYAGFLEGGKAVCLHLHSLLPKYPINELDIDDAYSLLISLVNEINNLLTPEED